MMSGRTTRRYQSTPYPPYIPKVVAVDAGCIDSLYRWRPHAENGKDGVLPSPVSRICASVEFVVPSKLHPHIEAASLANHSGYLAFRLVHVRTFPASCYLLCSAFLLDADRRWVDGVLIEGLFDSVKSVQWDCGGNAPISRIEYGLDCHLQLSLAHWQERRKRFTEELEQEMKTDYLGKASEIEARLKEIRLAKRSDSVSGVKRQRLRKALLDTEAQEGDVARFLDSLVAAPPTCDLQDVFAIQWHVYLDEGPSWREHPRRTRKKGMRTQ